MIQINILIDSNKHAFESIKILIQTKIDVYLSVTVKKIIFLGVQEERFMDNAREDYEELGRASEEESERGSTDVHST